MEENEKYKLHHTYIWLASLEVLPIVFFATVFSIVPPLFASFEEYGITFIDPLVASILITVLFTLLVVGIILGVQALFYKYIWYEFGSDDFNYYSGVLSKKHAHVPYLKIQSVNQKTTLLQRLAGVCTVEIETAGGSSNKAIKIAYVKNEEAERIRQRVFKGKQGLPYGAENADDLASNTLGESGANKHNVLDYPAEYSDRFRGVFGGSELNTGFTTYEYSLSNKELILSAITGKSTFSITLLLGLVSVTVATLSFLMDALFVSEDAIIQAVYNVTLDSVGMNILLALFASIVFFLISIWVVITIGTCISYGGFRARRKDNRVEVEYGILSHRFSGMDIDRIQSIHISQSFFQRIIGYCSVSYGRIAASSEDGGSDKSVSLAADRLIVHPFLKLSCAQEIVESLTPEYGDMPRCVHRVGRCALRRALIRKVILCGGGFWLAVVTLIVSRLSLWAVSDASSIDAPAINELISIGTLVLFVLSFVIAAAEAIEAVLWYRFSGFGYNEHALLIRNGGFSTSVVVVPRRKMQFGYQRTNPFQRRLNVATLIVVTAAGYSCKKERLIDATQKDVTAWLQWMLPRNNVRYDDSQEHEARGCCEQGHQHTS